MAWKSRCVKKEKEVKDRKLKGNKSQTARLCCILNMAKNDICKWEKGSPWISPIVLLLMCDQGQYIYFNWAFYSEIIM